MKDWIKQILRENLDELRTFVKPSFGRGTEHNIFSSSVNPNILFKVGDKDNVLRWAEVFKSNPKLFPKIYRLGQTKDGKFYVEIEKLDTNKVLDEWNKMESTLEQIGAVDTDVFEETIDNLFIALVLGNENFNVIYKRLEFNKEIQGMFKKWVAFLIETYKYITMYGYKGLDIHRYNFAYDSSGNIKAIDI